MSSKGTSRDWWCLDPYHTLVGMVVGGKNPRLGEIAVERALEGLSRAEEGRIIIDREVMIERLLEREELCRIEAGQ